MRPIILSGQSLHMPDDNGKDHGNPGEASDAAFGSENLKRENLVADASGEETSQLPVQFNEIESANSYGEASLSENGYVGSADEAICVRPDAIGQIDKVVVDAETGKLVSVTAGGEMLPAERFFAICSLAGANDRGINHIEMILSKQQQQMETWMEVLSQQMSTMMNSMLRMEEYLSQKLERAAAEAEDAPAEATEAPAETSAAEELCGDEAQEQVSPSVSEIGQDAEPEAESAEASAQQLLASETEQDGLPAEELPLSEEADRCEQPADESDSEELPCEAEAPAEQDAAFDAPSAETEAAEDAVSLTEEEDEADLYAELYSLKQPGASFEDGEEINLMRLDSIIAELEAEGLDRPEDSTDTQSTPTSESAEETEAAEETETADTSAESSVEEWRTRPARRETVQQASPSFWATCGSQVAGMGLFAAAYYLLTFFGIL